MRKRYNINGIVQGIGFRPFVAKTAKELGLTGFVLNTGHGVQIEVQGPEGLINTFEDKLNNEKPHGCFYIEFFSTICDEISNETDFRILNSDSKEDVFTFIPPDLATCNECIADIFDENNRRYLYPLTNCTNCGPRYTVIERLPYDRPNTSMKSFAMCKDCFAEYTDPQDRRYHAQPIACPNCGPMTYLLTKNKEKLPDPHLEKTAQLIKSGNIVAVKGIGGFLLACDALNQNAVLKLRSLKQRPEEPFALMANLESVRKHCFVSDEEEKLLRSPAAPIVLLKKKPSSAIPDCVAPRQNYLGFMLPYSPVHHLLLSYLPEAVLVMTSANLHGEVIYFSDSDIDDLLHLADYVLTHDRAIVTHVDDSVVETLADGPHIVRRSRGYVPLPLRLSSSNHPEILATGSDEKSTPALAKNGYAVLGQYIGDLNSKRSMDVYENVVNHLEDLFQIQPQVVVTDKHPSYFSHRYALSLNLPVLEVQHHLAHALSVMEEHSLTSAVAVIYDGTGYGDDGTLWGSEVMQVDGVNYKRLFHFGYIPLVGGEKAIEQPWRLAAALLDEKRAKQFFGEKGIQISQLAKTSSFPLACGMGRIFDAVSALLNVCQVMTYEGEPAQKLQMIAELNDETGSFADNVRIENQEICTIDIIENVLELLETGHEVTSVARLFHNTIVELTTKILMDIGCSNIVISGGTFQNVLLYNQLCTKLRNKGFNVYRNLQVPMNDNGLALGQIAYVLRRGDQENVLGYSNADNRDKWQHSPG